VHESLNLLELLESLVDLVKDRALLLLHLLGQIVCLVGDPETLDHVFRVRILREPLDLFRERHLIL